MDSVTLFVQDRAGRPLANKALRVRLQLSGWRRLPDGSPLPCHDCLQQQVRTDAQGKAHLALGFAFEGTWRAILTSGDAQMLALSQSEDILTVFEPPDRFLADGTPLWGPTREKKGPVVLVLMGFDASNAFTATQMMQLMAPVTDLIRAAGGSVAIVRFPDSQLLPGTLAPRAQQAIRTLAADMRERVSVVGISTGGLTARIALTDRLLPVRTLVTYDTPHRGANLNPQLQALIRRYAGPGMQRPLDSPITQAILRDYATKVHWKKRGLADWPEQVITRPWTPPSLPDWPRWCRTVALSNGSRRGANHSQTLLRLWQPFRQERVLARPADQQPGSLLSGLAGFSTALPLGIAGAEIRELPTFIPTESALDAPAETPPPVDAFFSVPEGATPLLHDQLSEAAARFLFYQIFHSV